MQDTEAVPNLTGLTVTEFLARLASGSPAPGGGSAAALAGALAAALVSMVTSLTLGKERYASVQDAMTLARERGQALQDVLASLVSQDAAAYSRVAAAYRLPRGTPDELAARRTAIQAALRGAVATPLATAVACVEVLELAAIAAESGNRSAAADAHVAALLGEAGLRGAHQNVLSNLPGIHEETFREETQARLAELLTAGETALARAMAARRPGV